MLNVNSVKMANAFLQEMDSCVDVNQDLQVNDVKYVIHVHQIQ
jgi:hypothetical protein